jgi:hypothetical protein
LTQTLKNRELPELSFSSESFFIFCQKHDKSRHNSEVDYCSAERFFKSLAQESGMDVRVKTSRWSIFLKNTAQEHTSISDIEKLKYQV